MPPGGSPKHAPPIETTPCGQRKGRHTRSAYGLLEGMSNGPSGSVEAVHDGVTPPPRDEPSIHWNGDHKGDDEAKEQAPPEEAFREPGCHGTRHDEDERVVDQLHRRDRDRIGGDREACCTPERNASSQDRAQSERVAEEEGQNN